MRLRLTRRQGGSQGGPFAVLREAAALVGRGLATRHRHLQAEVPRRRALLLLIGLTSATLTLGAVFGRRGYFERLKYEAEATRLRQEIASLRESNGRLDAGIRELEQDPAAIERLAREQLGWGRPGEVLVFLPDRNAADAPPRP